MVYDPNFPRRDSSTGCSPSLILALRTNALGGIQSGLHRLTTAATSSFSIILGVFNVICLTPEVDWATWGDAVAQFIPVAAS